MAFKCDCPQTFL